MKKLLPLLIISILSLSVFITKAQKSSGRICGTMEHLAALKNSDPTLQSRMQAIEQQTAIYVASQNISRTTAVTVTIPVVFHVVYATTAQNISDAQCIAQLNQLNLDYARLNSDTSNTPTIFKSVAANTKIQFCLAQRDPSGLATTGIIHKSTTTASFTTNDNVKKSTTGGDNAWSATSYLNIWTCNLSGGVLGYAQFPGGTAATDGVVLLYSSVGSFVKPGTATPYQLGRTATHEVGHWLNMYHIWGDATCGNDLVGDTPLHTAANYGCPAAGIKSTCTGTPVMMTMNYMDYTDDACMNMFTLGQTTRMNALFATGGSRIGLLTSLGCQPPAVATCGLATTLAATTITSSGATLGWAAVSGAASYNVQYRVVGAATWTSTTSTTNSKAITGLTASSNYEFQVQTVCTGSTSAFTASKTFSTIAATVTCGLATTLAATSITSSGATLGWTAVSGAASYNVQYRVVGAATWISTTSTTNSKAITGLAASSNYEFQVQTVCTGATSAFTASATFTTIAATATCGLATTLAASSITSSGATLGWVAVSGAASYNVQYRIVGAATWTSTTSTTNSKAITGLTASSNYEFQVQTVCAGATSAFTASATFTTSSATGCSDTYEANNTSATATAIASNTNISALINSTTDVDWYSFTTTTPNTNIKVALSALPADYDVSLYNSALTLLGSSANTGTTAEQIISNTATAGTYYIKVNGFNSAAMGNYDFTSGTAAPLNVPSKVTVSSLVQGNNNGTTVMVTNASVSSGYTGASGTFNAGAAARTGVLNTAASGTAYFSFTVTPTAGNIATLTGISFGSRSTSTGPLAYAIRSSLDGYVANITSGTLTNTSAWTLISNTALSVSSASGTAITFRIYGYNGTGTASANTANWRIDDINLTGSVNSFNATQCYSLIANTGATAYRIMQVSAKSSDVTIYPNPASDHLNIDYVASKNMQTQLQVMDQLGRVVLTKSAFLFSGKNKIVLNTSSLIRGIYSIKINDASNANVGKFVIE